MRAFPCKHIRTHTPPSRDWWRSKGMSSCARIQTCLLKKARFVFMGWKQQQQQFLFNKNLNIYYA